MSTDAETVEGIIEGMYDIYVCSKHRSSLFATICTPYRYLMCLCFSSIFIRRPLN
jgi:hypothetical protein